MHLLRTPQGKGFGKKRNGNRAMNFDGSNLNCLQVGMSTTKPKPGALTPNVSATDARPTCEWVKAQIGLSADCQKNFVDMKDQIIRDSKNQT